jgi:aminoglycoside phosphotransferase (APT) family kinase protein
MAAHPPVPAAALGLLAEHGVTGDDLRPYGKLGLRRPVARLGAGNVVLELALDDDGRARIRRELWGRAWAARAGLPTAAVHGADGEGSWLLAEWVPAAPAAGPRYLDRALATASALADAEPPPASPGASVWRSPRRAALARTARALRGRLPLRLWWAARTAARALPQVPIAHGDYYHRNVLWRPDAGEVCVVDWEYLGPGPRHGDALRLWTVLPERRDRDALLARLFAAAPVAQHRDIAMLALWLSLRLLGENIKSPRADRNRADLAHAWSVQPEARELAREHGAWPL